MRDAESKWIKDRQEKLKKLKEFNSLKLQLGLVEKNYLLICKGRSGNSDLELQSKRPVILSRDDTFSKSILINCHKRVGHLGVHWQNFVPDFGFQRVGSMLRNC